MGGGDATTQDNAVRDVYFDFCERDKLRPVSEAPNILQDLFTRVVVAGLLTFCVSQRWLLPKFCPMEPERFARSQSVRT